MALTWRMASMSSQSYHGRDNKNWKVRILKPQRVLQTLTFHIRPSLIISKTCLTIDSISLLSYRDWPILGGKKYTKFYPIDYPINYPIDYPIDSSTHNASLRSPQTQAASPVQQSSPILQAFSQTRSNLFSQDHPRPEFRESLEQKWRP